MWVRSNSFFNFTRKDSSSLLDIITLHSSKATRILRLYFIVYWEKSKTIPNSCEPNIVGCFLTSCQFPLVSLRNKFNQKPHKNVFIYIKLLNISSGSISKSINVSIQSAVYVNSWFLFQYYWYQQTIDTLTQSAVNFNSRLLFQYYLYQQTIDALTQSAVCFNGRLLIPYLSISTNNIDIVFASSCEVVIYSPNSS